MLKHRSRLCRGFMAQQLFSDVSLEYISECSNWIAALGIDGWITHMSVDGSHVYDRRLPTD
jgi:hypothetical protein